MSEEVVRPLLVWMTLLSLPTLAAAECPPGLVMSADTAGHCCWPAQAWSSARGRCVGTPTCPDGMQVNGDSCIVPQWQPPPQQWQPPPQQWQPPPQQWQPPPQWQPPQYTPYPPYAPPAPAPPAPRVPVQFVARDHADDRYRIMADGRSCTTPCTLELIVGEKWVSADSGGRLLGAKLHVPGTASTVAVSHRSRGHYVVGGALLAAGVAEIALGFWFALGTGFDGHEAVGGVNVALGGAAAIFGIVDLALTGRARFLLRASRAP